MLPRAKSNVTRLLPILPKHFHKLLLVKKNSPPCQKTSGKRGKRGKEREIEGKIGENREREKGEMREEDR